MITVSFPAPFIPDEQYFTLSGEDSLHCVFFDIETTGFKPDTSIVYLIGTAVRSFDGWQCTQWMLESPSEEILLLRTFEAFLRPYSTLIHFNGSRFDLPYLTKKYEAASLTSPFLSMQSLDLYCFIRPFRTILGLDKLNQKALESYLHIHRLDQYDGGELIQVFRQYLKSHDDHLLQLLLQHNREDVTGMLQLIRLLSMEQFRNSVPENISGEWNRIQSEADDFELLLRFTYSAAFPAVLTISNEVCTLKIDGSDAIITVHPFEGELRHYFSDYKSYFYLPMEDQAIHRSVARYVEHSARCPAKPDTCYIRKSGFFLPQPDKQFEPVFCRKRNDLITYFSCPEKAISDSVFLQQYANMLVSRLIPCNEKGGIHK